MPSNTAYAKFIQSELQLSLGRATWNAWLANAEFTYDPPTLKIITRNDNATAWITERIGPNTIQQIANTVTNSTVTILVQTAPPQTDQPRTDKPSQPTQPIDPFPSHKSNFVKTPEHFFTHILTDPNVKPSTKCVVGAIIHKTIGNWDRYGNWPEWWERVDYPELCIAAGIKSRTSAHAGVNTALKRGWIKRRKSPNHLHKYDYALRFTWDE